MSGRRPRVFARDPAPLPPRRPAAPLPPRRPAAPLPPRPRPPPPTPTHPSRLGAGCLVQLALQPSLREVYTELLRREGKEILLRDASDYASDGETHLSFDVLSQRARARGEVAMGVQCGGRTHLNPARGTKLRVGEGEQLIVLGELNN